jgi:AcrR family transcriptional regulator
MAKRLTERRDRRQEVIAAATRLFVTRGYHSATIDDIAAAVSLNKGTLYYYYESKANILFDILLGISEKQLSAVQQRREGSSADEAVREYIRRMVLFIVENRDEALLTLQESPFLDFWLSKDQARTLRDRYREIEGCLKKLIVEGIAKKDFVASDARVMAEAILGMVSWLPRWHQAKGRVSASELADQFSSLVIQGLQPRPKAVTPIISASPRRGLSEG